MGDICQILLGLLVLVGAWTIFSATNPKPRTGDELDAYNEEQRRPHTEARGKRKQRGKKSEVM